MPRAIRETSGRLISGKPLEGRQGGRIASFQNEVRTHFSEGTIITNLVQTKTGGTGAADLAITEALGGTGTITVGSDATAGQTVRTPRMFQCDTTAFFAPMVMEVRMKLSAATATEFFLGFCDTNQDANDKSYVVSATSTLTTSVPADAVGFIYSATPTSGVLFNSGANFIGTVGTNNSTDTVAATTVPIDTSYHVYRMELNSGGGAAAFIDGVFVGAVAAGVGPRVTVPLNVKLNVPGLAANKTYTLDYFYAGDGGQNGASGY
jgi:hypothetical protein